MFPLLAAAAVLLAGSLPAEPSGAGGERSAGSSGYPFSIRLRLSPGALRARFVHGGGGGFFSPPNPSCTAAVGEQARDAYAAALRRMARKDASDGAELEVSSVSAGVDLDADGWHAVLVHVLVLRDLAGDELGRWTVKGRQPIVGLGEKAIPAAFSRAAEITARRFESGFEEPAGVARWLAERGVEPGSTPRPAPPAEPQPPTLTRSPEGPPRGETALYLDLGGGIVPFDASNNHSQPVVGLPEPSVTTSRSDDVRYAFATRAGVSGRWAFAQLLLTKWRSPQMVAWNDAVRVTTFGVEAGPLLRLRPEVEVTAGLGLAWVYADAMRRPPGPPTPTQRQVLSAVGAVRYVSGNGPGPTRLRFGAEVRTTFRSRLEWVQDSSPFFRDWQELVIGTQVLAFVGLELPLAR